MNEALLGYDRITFFFVYSVNAWGSCMIKKMYEVNYKYALGYKTIHSE